jgi:hypothetical protein
LKSDAEFVQIEGEYVLIFNEERYYFGPDLSPRPLLSPNDFVSAPIKSLPGGCSDFGFFVLPDRGSRKDHVCGPYQIRFESLGNFDVADVSCKNRTSLSCKNDERNEIITRIFIQDDSFVLIILAPDTVSPSHFLRDN